MADSTRVCLETGKYRSVCCKVQISMIAGRTFPPCPICGRLSLWILVKMPAGLVA